jgi:hypothetical protein
MRTKFLLESLKGRDNSEGLGIDGRIILKWVLGKLVGEMDWIMWLRIGAGSGSCEHGNKLSSSIKGGKFLE